MFMRKIGDKYVKNDMLRGYLFVFWEESKIIQDFNSSICSFEG